jgi:HK97 family phage portal protein
MLFGLFGSETRSIENPAVSLTDVQAWQEVFGFGGTSAAGETVNEESALGVPAIWQAVNAIAGTIAHLPLHLYKIDADGSTKKAETDPLYRVIHDRVNGVQTSFSWRKWLVSRLLIDGRAVSLIIRNKAGRVMGFIALEWSKVTVSQSISDGRVSRRYAYQGVSKPYEAWEVLDIVLMPKPNGIDHYSPIYQNRNTIGLIQAAERYASTLFAAGGVPPLTLEMVPGSSPAAAQRASDNLNELLRLSTSNKRNILPIPTGHKLSPVGIDPQKQQMIELRRFQISEVCRIFNISPAMIHDLSTGTYSNVEQQNLYYAQHTITPLIKMIEQEMNLKLFGDRNRSNYVEFNLDGLMRGDFATRMDGLARAVNSAMITPNEARALDNRPPLEGGDELLIQGATVPLGQQPTAPQPTQTIQPEVQ